MAAEFFGPGSPTAWRRALAWALRTHARGKFERGRIRGGVRACQAGGSVQVVVGDRPTELPLPLLLQYGWAAEKA